MRLRSLLQATIVVAMSLSLGGCAVVAVTSAAVTVASTAVSVGVTAGSLAVGAATTVVKGTVKVGDALIGDDEE